MLQKQLLPIILGGLDQKQDPKTAAVGTITAMSNCYMDKQGRIVKRQGLAQQSMVSVSGETGIQARQVAARGSELLMISGAKVYARDTTASKWVSRGHAAHERLDLYGMASLTSTASGVSSGLRIDSSVRPAGDLALVAFSNASGDAAGDNGYMIWDISRQCALVELQGKQWSNAVVTCDSSGNDFVVFSAVGATVTASLVTAASGFRTIVDFNMASGTGAPVFDAIQIGSHEWLLSWSYPESSTDLNVAKVTLTTGTLSIGTATVIDGTAEARTIAWLGIDSVESTAQLAWWDSSYEYGLQTAAIGLSTVAVEGSIEACDDDSIEACSRISGGLPSTRTDGWIIFYECEPDESSVDVKYWLPTGSVYGTLANSARLLTRSFTVAGSGGNEVSVGVGWTSTWQPSAFVLRVTREEDDEGGVYISSVAIGAHLCNGNWAGRSPGVASVSTVVSSSRAHFCLQRLQSLDSTYGGRVQAVMATIAGRSGTITVGAPTEFARTTQIPGAILKQYDGQFVTETAFPMAPEAVTAAAGEDEYGVALEAGTYLYTTVAQWTDANGRVYYSAPSPPVSVNVAAGDHVEISAPYLHITERDPWFNVYAPPQCWLMLFRTLPNGSVFYLSDRTENDAKATAYTDWLDPTSNEVLATRQTLYTTGGILENWTPPGVTSACVHQGRLVCVGSDDRVYFSKIDSDGLGTGMPEDFQFEVEAAGGRLVAAVSLDDKLVIGKADRIYVLTGQGPDNAGTPVYDQPFLVSSGTGPSSARAIARTPDGAIMSTPKGPHILTRGLELVYVGAAVEDLGLTSAVGVAAVAHPAFNHVRLAYNNGVTLVYDWTVNRPTQRGQWSAWRYASSNYPVSAVAVGNAIYYVDAVGSSVMLADSGWSDNGSPYSQYFTLSLVSPAGPNGWSRVYAMRFQAAAIGNTTATWALTTDGRSSADTYALAVTAGTELRPVIKPRIGKCSGLQLRIGEDEGVATAGIAVSSASLLVGGKGGIGQPGNSQRVSRRT